MPTLSAPRWQRGDIKIHSGTLNDIPDGWALCDGANGTPPLVNRVMVGAGGLYAKGDTFGQDAVRPTITVNPHTLSWAQMPYHNHGVYSQDWGDSGGNLANTRDTHNVRLRNTEPAGSSVPHAHGATSSIVDTRQSSVAVIWIMKL